MSIDIKKVKDKIKKLFALSKSSNANEAAIALEMAQKLMIEHDIKRNEVGEFEIAEETIKGNSGERPPQYETYIVSNIASSFGCRNAYGYLKLVNNRLSFGYTFVGLAHKIQVASFIAEVLLRKMKKARREYMKKLHRVRSRANKIKRADDFCFGWACTVVEKLKYFSNTDKEQLAIDNYIDNLKWGNNLKTISRSSIKNSKINDYINGRREGANVQIQSGIAGGKSGIGLLEA